MMMPYKLVVAVLITSARVANAQFTYGNFGGAGWSGGTWGSTLNQMASSRPDPSVPGDASAKQHDIDFATRNVDANGGIFSRQGIEAHRAARDRATGNHYQHQPLRNQNWNV